MRLICKPRFIGDSFETANCLVLDVSESAAADLVLAFTVVRGARETLQQRCGFDCEKTPAIFPNPPLKAELIEYNGAVPATGWQVIDDGKAIESEDGKLFYRSEVHFGDRGIIFGFWPHSTAEIQSQWMTLQELKNIARGADPYESLLDRVRDLLGF